MQFLKTNWVSVLSGGLALVAVVILAMGLTSDSVQKEMQQRLAVTTDIDSLMRDPKNEACINAEVQGRQKFDQEFRATMDVAERINKREPLLDGVFPKAANDALSFRFQETYRERLYKLPQEMKAGDLPSPQEVQDEREILADIERRKQEELASAAGAAKPASPTPQVRPGPGQYYPPGYNPSMFGPRGGGWPGWQGGGRGTFGGGPDNIAIPEEQARLRAANKKVRAIRIYAAVDPARSSFHISPLWDLSSAAKPTPREMWYSQVALWVQEDVVRAIAALNDEAAKRPGLKEVNATTLPVKRLVSTRVLGYVTSTGMSVPFVTQAGGAGGALSGSELFTPSFTGRKSDDQFDVIRFTVTVIVDRRDLMRLVDAVTKVNFYQLIGAAYTLPNEADQAAGYYYGEAPVVQATLDFEGYLARKVYTAWMPAEVLEDLGIKREGGPQ